MALPTKIQRALDQRHAYMADIEGVPSGTRSQKVPTPGVRLRQHPSMVKTELALDINVRIAYHTNSISLTKTAAETGHPSRTAASTFGNLKLSIPEKVLVNEAANSKAWVEPVCQSLDYSVSIGYGALQEGRDGDNELCSNFPCDTLPPPSATDEHSGWLRLASQNDLPKSFVSPSSEQRFDSFIQPHIKRSRSSSLASVESYKGEDRESRKLRRTDFPLQSSINMEAAYTSTRKGDERDIVSARNDDERDIVDILLDQWTISVY
jgi:hypothetical protein